MAGMRMLFATDGSTGAGQALQLLASSFEPGGVEFVEVISVVGLVPGVPTAERSEAPFRFIEQARRDAAEQLVRGAAERLRAAGFEAVETVRAGHPAETIVTHAIAGKPDLIVLGARGLSGLRRRIAGSVSGKVARYAPTSVLVARAAGPIRSVLFGYDASPDADEALELVARLPLHGGAQVTVLSAYDVVRPFTSGLAPTMVAQVHAAYSDSLRWAREAAEAMASNAGRRLRERGVSVTHWTASGPAREQLAIVASELSADLLVVGSRGLSAIQRFFLGSTSAALVTRPPTSVLVARSLGAFR
jgi:nucleotide-binding universal stress UspA family protein